MAVLVYGTIYMKKKSICQNEGWGFCFSKAGNEEV